MIRKRGSKWQALVKVRDTETGDYRQLTATRPTKDEAQRWLTATLVKYGDSGGLAFGVTVDELLDAWWDIASPEWSPTTRRNNLSILRHHIRPKWGKTPLRKVRPVDLDTWYASLRHMMAPATIRRIHGVMSLAFTQAVRWQWLSDNPVALARPPRMTKSTITPPATEELIVLLEAANAHDAKIGTALHMVAATGARRGELCGIRWDDLDLDQGTVRICRSVVLGDNDSLVIKPTKTGNVRRIGLDAGTVKRLRAHLKFCETEAKTSGKRVKPDGFVFSNEADCSKPWRPEYISNHYEAIRAKCGLRSVRLHDLRHYHATHLLASGIDLATVAERLGHASGGRTTLAIYAHFLESSDRRAADVIGGLLDRR